MKHLLQALMRRPSLQGCGVEVKDRDGCNPLYAAVAWNRLEAVMQLFVMGCPAAVKSNDGRMPIHTAAEQGWVELIDLLVQNMGNQVTCNLHMPVQRPQTRPIASVMAQRQQCIVAERLS